MFMNKCIRGIVATTGIMFGVGTAQAATISLLPLSGPVPTGGQETFILVADFGTTSVLAGGTDFTWDPSVVTFQSFAFDSVFASLRDPSFDASGSGTDPWDLQAANLVSIGFGNFAGISIPADTVIGTLTFNAVGAPGSSTPISLSDSVKWAGYYDTGSNPISVDYNGTTASTGVSAVPLPAAGWLLISGLIGMAGVARRQPRTSVSA